MDQSQTSVSMADIAEAASVAVSTVSRALSNAPGVSAAKREEILALARRMGYLAPTDAHSEPAASGPGSRESDRRTLRITAVVPESDRWIFGSILAGIHDVLSPYNAALQVRQGLSASERASFLADPNLANRTDLVILVPAPRDISVEALKALPLPIVIAGTVVDGVPSVGIDDVEVGRMATNYLHNLGLASIAYVGFLDHEGTSGVATQRRGEGYEEAMTRAGLEPRFVKVPFTPGPGRAAAEYLLATENLPDAVICSSDEIAVDLISTFRRAGVEIPEDISVIGVDDHPIAQVLGLTTIAQPAREQGREAARLALRILESPSSDSVGESIALPTRLVMRHTTRRHS